MEDFKRSSLTAHPFYLEHFVHIEALLNTKTTEEINEYLQVSETGKSQYNAMKRIYETELKAHQASLKRKKELVLLHFIVC